jgi:pyruvate ferredoxin oxidoreductase gamma subunit
MYRVRFHGRGGQGLKTASRVLGSALFLHGFEVQDAPRYGAERRGAPVFAYVRAAQEPVVERGIIRQADLVVVADASCIDAVGAGVLVGIHDATVLLIHGRVDRSSWGSGCRVRPLCSRSAAQMKILEQPSRRTWASAALGRRLDSSVTSQR